MGIIVAILGAVIVLFILALALAFWMLFWITFLTFMVGGLITTEIFHYGDTGFYLGGLGAVFIVWVIFGINNYYLEKRDKS